MPEPTIGHKTFILHFLDLLGQVLPSLAPSTDGGGTFQGVDLFEMVEGDDQRLKQACAKMGIDFRILKKVVREGDEVRSDVDVRQLYDKLLQDGRRGTQSAEDVMQMLNEVTVEADRLKSESPFLARPVPVDAVERHETPDPPKEEHDAKQHHQRDHDEEPESDDEDSSDDAELLTQVNRAMTTYQRIKF